MKLAFKSKSHIMENGHFSQTYKIPLEDVDAAKEKNGAGWGAKAMEFLGKGDFHRALHYLNLCLDKEFRNRILNGVTTTSSDSTSQEGKRLAQDLENEAIEHDILCQEDIGITPADAVSMFEKRCLIHMKLQRFDEVLHDARKILDMKTDYSLAYKCLLVALCKLNRLEQVNEILKLWQVCTPKDLDMMECRTKLSGLILAVKNGIEPADAFSRVEDLLGMSYDWLLGRQQQDPYWKFRRPPPGDSTFVLCLHFRFGHCSLGEKCPDAHGENELEEWIERSKLRKVTTLLDSIKMDSSESYIRNILAKLEEAGDPRTVLSDESLDGVKIKCHKALEVQVQARKKNNYKWTFAIETKKPLTHVCLLYDIHRQYFNISSAHIHGATSKIDLIPESNLDSLTQVLEISSPTANTHSSKKSGAFMYRVDIVFKPDVYGTFRQTIVFDFGEDVKAMRNVSVEVVPAPDNEPEEKNSGDNNEGRSSSPTFDKGSSYRAGVTWNFGNADVVDGMHGEKVPSSKLGFALIGKPKWDAALEALKEPLSIANYKERMRSFLTQEERARQEILAKYNVTAPLNLMEKYLMNAGYNEGLTRYALDGSLYGCMTLFRDVSEDTAVGRLILRSCNFLLLTKTENARSAAESGSKPRVYLCPISDKTKNSVYIDIGKTCVSELGLKDLEVSSFDIQFQLDRTAFMEMKAVIDKLGDFHLNMLFPNFDIDHHIPWTPIKQWSLDLDSRVSLNPRQKESVIAITAEGSEIPPILVIGPFGTGKTFTLAQCIRKLLTQPNTRIMVCTHSNSAADLYIKEYLDPWVEEGFTAARPLRIYYELRNLNSVHATVLQYCKIEKLRFRPPTVEEIFAHQVIVVTLSTSYLLLNLNLPQDTFSHILLDEAAQAMESEAITPLLSAGKETKLVLAGDHMQLSPELFSDEAKSHHPSLLERLHCLYPDNHPCKLMLCENYRSHSAIIEYVSDAFYTKRLECGMVQPVHDQFYPLTFYAARGEEVQDQDSTSYYNMAEVFEIVEKVSELVASWPKKWGNYRNESAIGVLTPYADQVSRIRSRLRSKGLYSVSVERVLNVQGKQFRAVFLSTVRSFRPWVRILPEAVGNEVDLGFFSNPKLLNTALTRAQSLVVVIGDPVSLCSVGKCRNLWKDFVTICHENKSLYGISYSQLEQNILGVEMRLTWGLNPLADNFIPANPLTLNSEGRSGSNEYEQKSFSVTSKSSPSSAFVQTSPTKRVPKTILAPETSPIIPQNLPQSHSGYTGGGGSNALTSTHSVQNPRQMILPVGVPQQIQHPPIPNPGAMRAMGPMRPPYQHQGVYPGQAPGIIPDYNSASPVPPMGNQPPFGHPYHGFPGPPNMTRAPPSLVRPAVRPQMPYYVQPPMLTSRLGPGPMMNNPNHHPNSVQQQQQQSNFPPPPPWANQLQNRLPPVQHMGQPDLSSVNAFTSSPMINGHHGSSPLPSSAFTNSGPREMSGVGTSSLLQNSVTDSGRNIDSYATGVPLYKRGIAAAPPPNEQQPQSSRINSKYGSSIEAPPFLGGRTNLSAAEISIIEKMITDYQASSKVSEEEAQRLYAKLREISGGSAGVSGGGSGRSERNNFYSGNIGTGNMEQQPMMTQQQPQQQPNNNSFSNVHSPAMGNNFVDNTNWGMNQTSPNSNPAGFPTNQLSAMTNQFGREFSMNDGDMFFPNNGAMGRNNFGDHSPIIMSNNMNNFAPNPFMNDFPTGERRFQAEPIFNNERIVMERQAPLFGSLAAQLGSGGLNEHAMMQNLASIGQEQSSFESVDSGGGGAAGRSYANVVKNASKSANGGSMQNSTDRNFGSEFTDNLDRFASMDPAAAAAYFQHNSMGRNMPHY